MITELEQKRLLKLLRKLGVSTIESLRQYISIPEGETILAKINFLQNLGYIYIFDKSYSNRQPPPQLKVEDWDIYKTKFHVSPLGCFLLDNKRT
jgi:hypothetical protein